MKHYEKYKKALEAHGYTVDEKGTVFDKYGNQAAGEDRFGNVGCSDPNIITICRKAEEDMANLAKPKKVKKYVIDESIS